MDLDLQEILTHEYPSITRWISGRVQPDGSILSVEEQYATFEVNEGFEKPSLDEMLSKWPAVEEKLVELDEIKVRSRQVQLKYSLQEQIIILAKNIVNPDAKLKELIDLWSA